MDDEDDMIFSRGWDEADEWDYRQDQAAYRAAGWTAYNSDYVDEFPTW